jgi:hypothetical protein
VLNTCKLTVSQYKKIMHAVEEDGSWSVTETGNELSLYTIMDNIPLGKLIETLGAEAAVISRGDGW